MDKVIEKTGEYAEGWIHYHLVDGVAKPFVELDTYLRLKEVLYAVQSENEYLRASLVRSLKDALNTLGVKEVGK